MSETPLHGLHSRIGLHLGSHAPELSVCGLDSPGRGEPRVLAFVHGGVSHERPAGLGAIRAELRGLGAELVVVSPAGVWRVRADDPLEPLASAGDALATAASQAAASYGVSAGDDAVFVIDGRGMVRFSHQLAADGARDARSVWPMLGDALAIAGRAMHARETHDARQRVLLTRREWTVTCLVVGCATAFLAGCREQHHEPAERRPQAAEAAPANVDVVLTINGRQRRLSIDPRSSLLDILRERLGLTGTKKGCDAGQCGACTVLAGGKRIKSCLTLAVMAQGRPVTTIEGLADGGTLHPMQRAFAEHDGLQCGFCTPGQIMSAVGLIAEGHATTDDEVREQMSGNICRCGAYPNIIAAIQAARRTRS
jgi:xanthine dehydrogenase YagT iron-sulfur-binding subunit